MEQGAPQPSFGAISNSFHALSQEFALCGNLPAVDSGARLQRTLETISEQLALLNRKVDGVDRRVQELDRKVIVLNQNFTARMENNVVVHGNQGLVPLHSVLTGDLIDGFPSTLDELEALSAREIDAILRQLGETGRGRLDARKRQLKVAVGVTRQVV